MPNGLVSIAVSRGFPAVLDFYRKAPRSCDWALYTFSVHGGSLLYERRKTNQPTNKKHLDASVKERPQTLLVPSEEIFKRVLCNKHI